ncbi:hypothetical protein C3747_17g369 [Trypanosoma cruzi]|uniref:RNase H type-1 domain-containing protein n=1 Tax=Trypanosoma cruzi TaxID=5693 RepID=A0A2V2XBF0_TRYCR|nr:hypothetical protein C3747_17g369 [Trypanosoma cruzi]RNC52205.1 hypothetical protein TcCL_ESM10602 [Trypanosoma cruzi]
MDGQSSSPAEPASGSVALLYDYTTANDAPVEVHRAAAGRLACSYRAECLAIENGFGHLMPPCLGTSQSPTRILVATDSLSAIEAFRCPLAMRDRVTEAILIMPLSLVKRGRPVEFIFSPSHCGIPRNEATDEEATISISLPQEGIPIWHVDFLTAVKRLCWKEFQEEAEGAYTARQAFVGVARTPFLISSQK